MATWFFIKNNDFSLTLDFCKKFLNDKHHLIHKACGWMMREVGKRNQDILLSFLNENYTSMPSIYKTYATEKLSINLKEKFKCVK